MSMWKNSHVFGVRTSRNPQNCQISHYWYAWGQPGPVTSDDLWKVNIQLKFQRLHVDKCWPKSCIISPFLLMAASYMTGQHDFLEKPVGDCTSYDVIGRWPDLTRSIFFCQKLWKGCPISYAKHQCDSPRGSAAIPEKLRSCINPLAQARVNVS